MRRNIKIDSERANSLLKMAKITLERLNSFNKLKYPTNTINDYYDILHKLMESYSILNGIKFSGENAHKNLIDYTCKELFNIGGKIFLQNLRQIRNQISYEGFTLNSDFLDRNIKRIEDHIAYLIKKIEIRLKNV